MKRRSFLGLIGGAGLVAPSHLRVALGSCGIPQTPLPGKVVPKYVEPLPVFAGNRVTGSSIAVQMLEIQQKVLPASFYSGLSGPFNAGTYVWAYKVGAKPAFYPGFSIEAVRGMPVAVTYVNNLPLAPVLQKYLTTDQTIHWANPKGLPMGDPERMLPYSGPQPAVVHLHGAEVPSSYDGGPEQWFTPDGLRGPGANPPRAGGANADTYVYPNSQEATTLWFHDHTLGATRLNVYAGLAAFYLLRDGNDTGAPDNPLRVPAGAQEIELAIQDRQFDTNGQWFFPDSEAQEGLNGPPPNPDLHPFWNPEFFGDVIVVNGKSWPYLEVEPRRYRFRLLDGSNARFYELRLMNVSTDKPGPAFWAIGTDGGLLDVPVKLSGPDSPGDKGPRLLIAPGERFDVIVDFSGYAGQTLTLVNGAKAPYPKGMSADPSTTGRIMQFCVTKPLSGADTTYNPAAGKPLRSPMIRLVNSTAGTPAAGVQIDQRRQLVLVEVEGEGGPEEVLVNNTKWEGLREGTMEPVPGCTPDAHGVYTSELPRVGSTEVWEVINLTGDAHPIHLHLVQFQLMNRQSFNAKQYTALYERSFPGGAFIPGYGPPLDYLIPNHAGALGGNPDVTPHLQGLPQPPLPEEAGWKDTVKMYPGTVTRIAVRFAPQGIAIKDVTPGQNKYPFKPWEGPGYVWHCHIVDHEDNEMMRPYHPVP